MNRTKIEWSDYSWNPIKGICPVDCKLPDGRSYCYAKRMYQRFGWNPNIYLHHKDIFQPIKLKKPSKIFVCSTIELFHEKITTKRRDIIFDVIKDCPQHTFQILTKFPQNIDREMPDNVWLGVSVTEEKANEVCRIFDLKNAKAKIKFISFEPLLSGFHYDLSNSEVDWVIIGRLTQHGHKYDPKLGWIKDIVSHCEWHGIKIFLKDNLKDIWGEPLIQEFPKETSK